MSEPQRTKERTAPLSVRFSDTERARLTELAGNKPLSQFIRERALEGQSEPRRAHKAPVKDGETLGQLLALLGQSRIANNLNQLAKAVNQGSLPVTAEVEADLQAACAQVREMRLLLLQGLGIRILEEAGAPSAVAEQFADAAQDNRP